MAASTKDYSAIMAGINQGLAALRGEAGETLQAFTALSKAATADNALDKKTKELIALAIGIATKCDGCIGFHTRALAKLGATDAEIADTLAMTVYMGGGPSLMYAADAWTAWEQAKD